MVFIVLSIALISVVSTGQVQAESTFAYKDADGSIHIRTDYYMANSTSAGTFDFKGLDGAMLAENSPDFEAGYGEDSKKIIMSAGFEVDSDADGKPDGWSYDYDMLGGFFDLIGITLWEKSTEMKVDGNHSLELEDKIGFLKKEALSEQIPVTQGKRYRINGSIYSENVRYISPTSGYAVYILLYDEDGNLLRSREGMEICEVQGSWVNFSYYVWNVPDEAKYMKVLLRQSRSAKGHAYFDNIQVMELVETKASTQYKAPVDPKLTVHGNTASVSYNHTMPEVYVTTNFTFHQTEPYVDYSINVVYREDVTVRFEKILFDINSDEGKVLLRDYNITRLEEGTFNSGQWTSKIVEFDYPSGDRLSFIGVDNAQSMVLKPGDGHSNLSLYLDNERNHPYTYHIENKVLDIDETNRHKGEEHLYFVTFGFNDTGKHITKMRQPYGYLATLIFTEHPDGEETAKSRAIAYGHSDQSNVDYGKGGIIGNNLTWTKGIFVYEFEDYFADALMEKTEYKTLIDQMFSDGVEIVPHSMTWATENRTVVSDGLDLLDQYQARNWIDHDGNRDRSGNLEVLAKRGSIKGEYYILDLLHDHNYEYAWGYIDYSISEGLNLLEPQKTSVINPFMYYNSRIDDDPTDTDKIFLWSSINTEKIPDEYYTKTNVDRLINEKGVHIGHEYFDWETCEGHAYDKIPFKDEYKINDVFEGELEYIAKRRSEGDLWVTTVSEFGDYLRSTSDIRVTYEGKNEYIIRNDNDHPVYGLSFMTDKTDIKSIVVNDTVISDYRVVEGGIIFWMDVEANSEESVRFE